ALDGPYRQEGHGHQRRDAVQEGLDQGQRAVLRGIRGQALQRVGDGHGRGARFSGGRARGGLQIAAVTADQQGGADRVLRPMGHGAEGLEGHVPDGGGGVAGGGHGPEDREGTAGARVGGTGG